MGKKDNLIKRLESKPKDFEIRELDTLMGMCNCEKDNRGGTSGSAIKYQHLPTGKVFMCHSPHPSKVLKQYVIKNAIAFLQDTGEIK